MLILKILVYWLQCTISPKILATIHQFCVRSNLDYGNLSEFFTYGRKREIVNLIKNVPNFCCVSLLR